MKVESGSLVMLGKEWAKLAILVLSCNLCLATFLPRSFIETTWWERKRTVILCLRFGSHRMAKAKLGNFGGITDGNSFVDLGNHPGDESLQAA